MTGWINEPTCSVVFDSGFEFKFHDANYLPMQYNQFIALYGGINDMQCTIINDGYVVGFVMNGEPYINNARSSENKKAIAMSLLDSMNLHR